MIEENLLRKAYHATLTPQERNELNIPDEPTQEVIMNTEQQDFDEDDITDEEIDAMVDQLVSFDDIADAYSPEELAIIDAETGEFVSDINESMLITEVLSRGERIKAKIRMVRTKVKRQRKLQIALKRKATNDTVKTRARRLAVRSLKQRLAKKPLNKLSVADKERLEKIISKRRKVLDRVATKMMPRIRKIEQERLSHKSFTK